MKGRWHKKKREASRTGKPLQTAADRPASKEEQRTLLVLDGLLQLRYRAVGGEMHRHNLASQHLHRNGCKARALSREGV